MKGLLVSVLTTAFLTAISLAQSPPSSASESQNTGMRLAPGTVIRVELAKTIDAKKAKVG